MTGKKKTGPAWHHTSVVLREDMYHKALEQGIDISDACNRALATLTGSEYSGLQREEIPAPPPVIIAKDGSTPNEFREIKQIPLKKMHPVINADDPAAPAKVVQAKTQPLKKAPAEPAAESLAPVPAPAPVFPEEKPVAEPTVNPRKAAVKKGDTASARKRPKGDALKTFFSLKIARSDAEEDRVGKDELYELFTRYCRDHHVLPVPDRRAVTVALKNQFALNEKIRDGASCWTGIRLK